MKNIERIKDVKRNIEKLISNIEYYNNNPSNVKSIQKCAYLSDKIALDLRNESIESSGQYTELRNKIYSNKITSFKYFINKIWNNSLVFTLPPLLNFKVLERKNNETYAAKFNIINEQLLDMFYKFKATNEWVEPKDKSILMVVNVVSNDTPKYFISDTDNRNYSSLINAVKQFFIRDDSYEFLSFFYDTVKFGNLNKTVCLLIAPEDKETAFEYITNNIEMLLEPENLNTNKDKILKFNKKTSQKL